MEIRYWFSLIIIVLSLIGVIMDKIDIGQHYIITVLTLIYANTV